MELELKGKTAVVTGASRGIGLATVRALVGEGMRVVGAARSVTPQLAESGAVPVALDLSDAESPAVLIETATAELGDLDLLVNNVGGGDGDMTGGFLSFDERQWQDVFELNFFATVRTCRAALPSLLRRGGSIVNVSSIGARLPHSGPVPYTTAKAALTALGKALAEEFGPQGIRVNTVSPGPVCTALWESADGHGARLAEAMNLGHRELVAGLPAAMGMVTGRMIEPEEIASAVAYLASPHAASVTGTDHVIDGGAIKTV